MSCVKNGGFVSHAFEMKRGVRQGCPISPLIFIMTVELLALKLEQDKEVKGISIYKQDNTIKIK